jgi:hypothetical protein
MVYCSDVDLLHWEPNIFRDAVFASQLLLSGTGSLTGTTFTLAAGSLSSAHVVSDEVIVLSGALAGSFPIVSVNSATELTLSVLYDGLFPDSGSVVASPVGTAADLAFAVRTFWPQRRVVSDLISRAAGIEPDDESPAVVVNAQALRRPCALGTLQMIYNALAAASSAPEPLSMRADLYERLYRRSLSRARVELDTDGDGRADVARTLNVLELARV